MGRVQNNGEKIINSTLVSGATTIFDQVNVPLVSVEDQGPKPYVLSVSTRALVEEVSYLQEMQTPWYWPGMVNMAGISSSSYASIVVSYGSRGMTRRRMFDCKCGVYQLPPCEQITVQAFAWREAAWGDAFAVSADLDEGVVSNPDTPIFSFEDQLAAAADTIAILPPGARYFDVSPGEGGEITVSDGWTLYMLRDLATPSFVPPWTPVELAPFNRSLTITNIGAAQCSLFGRFWLGW